MTPSTGSSAGSRRDGAGAEAVCPAHQLAAAWCRVTLINLSAGALDASVVWNQLQASGATEVGARFQGPDGKQQLLIGRLPGFLPTSV